ncbi:hypothetical protein [Flavobacterium sp. NKUCC04_CG]|uniref:hypothetical protein n=1 Tax=Flavobacterium sp. NKUCC04_CG TaxID=2842121 RepID=UPI001C5B71C4|nr:hypothetical protein [Flavobacterium sp. NKUCC04_CG]MBW3520093.1 hypothetical protein [Flavobacterium sp. NKUCC04_CG]
MMYLSVFLLLPTAHVWAQQPKTVYKEVSDPIYKTVDTNPDFPGGIAALQRYLSTNLIVPIEVKAAIDSEYARVVMSFIIEKDGALSELLFLQGIQEEYNELIKDVLIKGPKWVPALLNGEAVRYKFIMPISMNVEKLRTTRLKK